MRPVWLSGFFFFFFAYFCSYFGYIYINHIINHLKHLWRYKIKSLLILSEKVRPVKFRSLKQNCFFFINLKDLKPATILGVFFELLQNNSECFLLENVFRYVLNFRTYKFFNDAFVTCFLSFLPKKFHRRMEHFRLWRFMKVYYFSSVKLKKASLINL